MVWAGVLLLTASGRWWQGRIFVAGAISILSISSIAGLLIYLTSVHQRLFGLFFDPSTHTDAWPNAFALFVLMLWPLLLLWSPQRKLFKVLKISLFIVNFAAFFCTFSRAGFSVFIIQIVGILVWSGFAKGPRFIIKNPGWLIKKSAVLTLILVLSTLFAWAILHLRHDFFHRQTPLLADKIKFSNGEDVTSVQERFHFWEGSLQLAGQQPFLGFGPMSFNYVYRTVQRNWLEISDHPHNLFLKIAVENGLPAMFLMFLIIFIPFLRTIKNWRNYQEQTRFQLFVLWVAFGGGVLHNQVDFNLNFVLNFFIWWSLIKAIDQLSLFSAKSNNKKTSNNHLLVLGSVFGAAAFASFAFYPSLSRLFTGQNLPVEQRLYLGRNTLIDQGDWWRDQGKDTGQAEKFYQPQLSRNHFDPVAYSRIGELYLNDRRYSEALSYLEKAIKIDPKNNWSLHLQFVEALELLGKNEKIIDYSAYFIPVAEQYLPAVKANLHYDAQKANPKNLLKLLIIMAKHDPVNQKKYFEFEKIINQSIRKYSIQT